ncbi:hypothetical protein TP2_17895 [Thioclava pacifica DSM 10166]|uniref:Uncharacterized protein n=1 Tax=Thioclava pacifica DSM 10166 TaxID=1353537 RepID=A0A074JA27_9RHOB|nr:hypothetical protein TP2_17895 [Thioclava pacifica DSM 10166]
MMHPARAILLDHDLERLLRAHKVTSEELAKMLSPSAPPKPEARDDPAAERRRVRNEALIACADRLDPNRDRSILSIHGEIKSAFRAVNSKAQPSGRGIEPIVWNLRSLRAAGMAKPILGYDAFRTLLVENGWPARGKFARVNC